VQGGFLLRAAALPGMAIPALKPRQFKPHQRAVTEQPEVLSFVGKPQILLARPPPGLAIFDMNLQIHLYKAEKSGNLKRLPFIHIPLFPARRSYTHVLLRHRIARSKLPLKSMEAIYLAFCQLQVRLQSPKDNHN